MQSIRNSWELVKASFRVLQSDKELLVFPIVSAIGVLIVTLSFLIPMVLGGFFDAVTVGGSGVATFLVMLLFYIVQYVVIFFANTALVGAALIRLRGGDPTIQDGLRIASSRFGAILGYALIAGTVGMLLKAISQRSGAIGQIVISLIGLAWNLATFLVVPVLAVEGVGPIESLKRSVALLKRTWGEQIVGNFGLGAVFGLVILGMILLLIPLVALAMAADSVALGVILVGGWVVVVVLLALMQSTLSGIYTAAVYQFAADGTTGKFFAPELVQNAFRPDTRSKFRMGL